MPPPPSQTTKSQLFFFLLLLSLCVLVLLRVLSGEVPDQGEAAALFRRWRQEGRSLRPRERGTCLCTCTNQETAFVQRAHAFERKEGLEQSLTREECCAQRSYACGGENHPREVAAPVGGPRGPVSASLVQEKPKPRPEHTIPTLWAGTSRSSACPWPSSRSVLFSRLIVVEGFPAHFLFFSLHLMHVFFFTPLFFFFFRIVFALL